MKKQDKIASLIGGKRKDAYQLVGRVNNSLPDRVSLNQIIRVLRRLREDQCGPEEVIIALGGDPVWIRPATTARRVRIRLPGWANSREADVSLPTVSRVARQYVAYPDDTSGQIWDVQTAVVGVTFENRQATVALLSHGEQVWLRREPDNPFDPNAIRVERVSGAQVGYISRYLAARLAPIFDECRSVVPASVLAIVGGYYECSALGVKIGFNLPNDSLAYLNNLSEVNPTSAG